jgi:2-polyprenyl-6-hydroxyphenyl methylase / 3-demethylubiquinone-9 3-methyltransferase
MTRGRVEAVRLTNGSVDAAEIGRFAAPVDAWWDPNGRFRELHRFNPVRLGYIRSRLLAHFERPPTALQPFAGLSLLDIGCGGGLVAEGMARLGFIVTGIDAGVEAISSARAHGEATGLHIDYRVSTVEALATQGDQFHAVVALEVIEHVADRNVFYRSLGKLVRPGGALIAATLNRTARSFALAIVGAEYILRWLPRGSHDWRRFVRPSELALNLRRNNLHVTHLAGIQFDPRAGEWSLSEHLTVNYLAVAVRR